ncbi:receptor activity-modifying protein 3-like [Scleropages formosus]|uniref:Receptor activity-modifying protein 3 n=1 Tax=Scleropages formosus TaxID=113540 RepID=A0A8C9WGF3_SCLFO|nr:receptor activity-modifying protein 3-like [Scleropages formosus]
MDTNALRALRLSVTALIVNTFVTTGLSAIDKANLKPRVCNETALLIEIEKCGDRFQRDMMQVDPHNWCNLTHFIRDYNVFSYCTEWSAEDIGCYWPNPLVENYIIRVHKLFFSNCTVEPILWVDPPDNMLALLILTPVLLTLVMTILVAWYSRRGDILA